MKILLITQLFQPEPNHLKGLAFAQELKRLGHSVEVLTGFPNYPGGKLYPGYRQSWRMWEELDGIPVIRVPLFPDHSSSGLRRILCYVTLALSACLPGLALVQRPDVVHVYQGPATLALPAMLLRIIFGIPFVLDVQDIWPDSVLSSGMFRYPSAKRWLDAWCGLTYALASKIVVLSPGYRSTLMERGVPAAKLEVVYNWCAEIPNRSLSDVESKADSFGLRGYFNVVYAGNLGRVQALESVVRAAGLLQQSHPEIHFVFVGDGVDANFLKQISADEAISNVSFIPRQPVGQVGVILDQADALLIHLRDDPLCRIGIPQKTQAYLAAGRPVVMAVKGDACELINKAQAGIVCEPENPRSIAEAVLALYRMSEAQRCLMGQNGAAYYRKYLSFERGSRQMDTIFAAAKCAKQEKR